MAFENVKPTEEDRNNENIWELWLLAKETLNPKSRMYGLIKKLAQPQIDDLEDMNEDV